MWLRHVCRLSRILRSSAPIALSRIAIVHEFQELDVGGVQRRLQFALALEAEVFDVSLRDLLAAEDTHENSDNFFDVSGHYVVSEIGLLAAAPAVRPFYDNSDLAVLPADQHGRFAGGVSTLGR